MATLSTFAAFVSAESDMSELKAFAEKQGLPTDLIRQGTIAEASEYLKTNPSPDLLVVELPSQDKAPPLLDALAEVCDPNTKVITIGKVNEYSFYCWLMEIGIAQYLLSPLSAQILETAFQKLQGIAAGNKEKPPAKLIAVMGSRGGVGATTMAINLAGGLSEQVQKKVALVDLDPQEGSISLALDIQPSMGVRDVLEKPDRIDSLFLDRVMSKVGKFLAVLSAEERLSEHLTVNEEAAFPLLDELRGKYDYVVLDVPRHLGNFARACLQRADYTVLVTELSLLSLRDTLRMQDAMRDAWKMKPPIILANRVGLAPKQAVPLADFEKGIGTKVTAQVNFTPEIFMPITRDIPAIKQKNHATMKPIYQLIAMIAPQTKAVAETKKAGFSLFKKKET